MNSIEMKVIQYINSNHLLDGTKKVIVAASGGADSMSLLEFFNRNKDFLEVDVAAAHVNHGIRGETADRDEQFVKDYCEKNNIEFFSYNALSEGVVVPEHPSEEWARKLRYGFFDSLAGEGIKIATAHTVSDQAETVVMRLASGVGLRGLRGIRNARDHYIRPFLCIKRSHVEQLIGEYGITHITDESNLTDDYSRNKIRHNIIPELERVHPAAVDNINKISKRISDAYDYIHKVAEEKLHACEGNAYIWYNVDGFVNVDDIVLSEMISIILSHYDALDERYIEMIKNYINRNNHYDSEEEMILGELDIGNGRSILITNRYLSVELEVPDTSVRVGKNLIGNWGYGIKVEEMDISEYNKLNLKKNDLAFYADARKLDLSKLTLGTRREGDVFKPACRCRNRLGNYLNKFGLHERKEVPLVRNQSGSIIYFYNLGFTDGYTPGESTKKVYKFTPI